MGFFQSIHVAAYCVIALCALYCINVLVGVARTVMFKKSIDRGADALHEKLLNIPKGGKLSWTFDDAKGN